MGVQQLVWLKYQYANQSIPLFRITPSTTGFSRMGQIWSKPTLADIRVKEGYVNVY